MSQPYAPGAETPLRALSIRGPWWWFILHGGKRIENRSWPTRFRGPVLLHASKSFSLPVFTDDLDYGRRIAESQGITLPPVTIGDLRAMGGHIVGTATVTDCVTSSASPWFFGPYGFVLDDVRPVQTPIRIKGALGFFKVPAGTVVNVL
jgi:hypothetical protein